MADEATVAEGPQITFEETRHDFGRVERQVLKHAFKFKNTGNALLEIRAVADGCGVQVERDFEKTLLPGQEEMLKVRFDVEHRKGRFQKGPTVISNDPNHPEVHLTLTADAIMEVMVTPWRVDLGRWLLSETVTTHTLEVRSELREPLQIIDVNSTSSWLAAKLVSSTTDSAKIEFVTKPPLPFGHLRGDITILTAYEKEQNRKFVVTIYGYVPPTIRAFPASVILGPNASKPAKVRVSHAYRKDFRITDIKCPTPTITATIDRVDIRTEESGPLLTAGYSYFVTFDYAPGEGKTPPRGTIEILTDEPTWPKVEVPYSFAESK